MPISFRAHVWKVNVDHEREVTATFKIPFQEFENALKLAEFTQRRVIVTVFEEGEVRDGDNGGVADGD